MDAVQIVVRGFGSVGRMHDITQQLTELGFRIKTDIDGSSDSKGGIIETSIEDEQEVDVEGILKFRADNDDKPGDNGHWQTVEAIWLTQKEKR